MRFNFVSSFGSLDILEPVSFSLRFYGLVSYAVKGTHIKVMIYVIGFGAVMYTAVYFYFYAKKPKVFVKNSSNLHELMKEHMPAIKQTYNPPYWCPDGRFQTIVKNFVPPPRPVSYRREVVETIDGGQIYVDWVHNDSASQYPNADTRPTVFIVPGLTSTSQSNYVVSMVDLLTEKGYRCMVIINRGLDGMDILTPKAYCATHTIDMELVINIFKERYPNAPLVAIGVSLGSLMLGRYVAQKGPDSKLAGVMLWSCPFDPVEGSKSLEKWDNRVLFNFHLTRGLKNLYRNFKPLFTHIVDDEMVLQSKTLRDYDSSFTAKVFGYGSVDEYYEDAVISEKLSLFRVPTVCVCSDDDPFSPFYALPIKQVENAENVALIVTHGGGHVSHMDGINPFAKSYFEKIMEQFIAGIFST